MKNGGIINNNGKRSVKNCNFKNNISKKQGCAIYNKEGYMKISYSGFESNSPMIVVVL